MNEHLYDAMRHALNAAQNAATMAKTGVTFPGVSTARIQLMQAMQSLARIPVTIEDGPVYIPYDERNGFGG